MSNVPVMKNLPTPTAAAVKLNSKPDQRDKVSKILTAFSIQQSKKSSSQSKPYSIDASATALLCSYAKELTSAILEESANLAKHRKSKEISVDDVNLVLVKKHGIDASLKTKKTHMQMIKSLPVVGQAKEDPIVSHSLNSAPPTSNVKNILSAASSNNSNNQGISKSLSVSVGGTQATIDTSEAPKKKKPSKRKIDPDAPKPPAKQQTPQQSVPGVPVNPATAVSAAPPIKIQIPSQSSVSKNSSANPSMSQQPPRPQPPMNIQSNIPHRSV